MSEKSLATQPAHDAQTLTKVVDSIVLRGDFSGLSPADRTRFYVQVCEGLGLNAAARPFDFLRLQGKEVMYANKNAADQLAAIHRVTRRTIDGPKVIDLAGTKLVYAVCEASLPNGRVETATATVPLADPMNVLMKCETKAKRRATLSILGLAILDEMELETIPAAVQSPGGGVDLSLASRGIEQPQPARADVVQPEAARDLVAEVRESAAVRHTVRELADLWRSSRDELKAAKLEQKAWDVIAARCMGLKIIPKAVTAEIKRLDDETRGPGPKGGAPKPAAPTSTDATSTPIGQRETLPAPPQASAEAWRETAAGIVSHVARITSPRHLESSARQHLRAIREDLQTGAVHAYAGRLQRLSHDGQSALPWDECVHRAETWLREGPRVAVLAPRPPQSTRRAAGGGR